VKVLRYEIKDIIPPVTVTDALEKQMRAERERRAVVAESEGERQAKINVSEGQKQETINLSEADKQRQINEAEGRAREIELIANATAQGLREVARALIEPGGREAMNLRIAEQYVREFGKLADENNTLILPSNLADVGGIVATLATVMDRVGSDDRGDAPTPAQRSAPAERGSVTRGQTSATRPASPEGRTLADRLGDIAGLPPG
jgi:regulator of protease activity HflC (stomatin/prohibitin superfamily)